jgi:hypothetical protein
VAAKNGEKSTLGGLARKLGELPADKKRAALEMSAALAGVSVRVSRAFVEAVPAASEILSADDLRRWAELGRRLAMSSAAAGTKFFNEGVDAVANVPEPARAAVFQICERQLVLSSSTALATLELMPTLVDKVRDEKFLTDVLDLTVDVSQRSAKHSAQLLEHTPKVAAAVARIDNDEVTDAVLSLASQFANRTGGMAADLWAKLPVSLKKLTAEQALLLMRRAEEFLEYGGSVTIYFVISGSEVLASVPTVFEDWRGSANVIARHGNAVLISYLRVTPKVLRSFGQGKADAAVAIRSVMQLTAKIAETDAESALAAFRSSPDALRKVSLKQFEEWVENGLGTRSDDTSKARRSYFALETRESNERLQKTKLGLSLESIQPVLRMYVEALTGREVEVAPLAAMPQESRIGDGKTIFLPSSVAEFSDDEKDFRLYKVLAAHAAGQIEFGTFERDTTELHAAYTELSQLYAMTAEERDAFSMDGQLYDVGQKQANSPPYEGGVAEGRGGSLDGDKTTQRNGDLPPNSDYREALKTFPEPRLARKIFATMENARIDHCLRQSYRGLRRDLDLMRSLLKSNRPYIFDLPIHQVPFELLFQITLCGGANDDAKMFYSQIVSEIESVLETFINRRDA